MISTVGNVTEARRAKITFPAVYIPHPTSPSEMANCFRQQCVIGIFCGAFPDIHDYGVAGNMVGSHNSPSPKAMPTHNTYTAGNGNFTSFISIPYCANDDLPSPKAMSTHNTYTAGNGNFTSFISISYCANHDLPSPTDL